MSSEGKYIYTIDIINSIYNTNSTISQETNPSSFLQLLPKTIMASAIDLIDPEPTNNTTFFRPEVVYMLLFFPFVEDHGSLLLQHPHFIFAYSLINIEEKNNQENRKINSTLKKKGIISWKVKA